MVAAEATCYSKVFAVASMSYYCAMTVYPKVLTVASMSYCAMTVYPKVLAVASMSYCAMTVYPTWVSAASARRCPSCWTSRASARSYPTWAMDPSSHRQADSVSHCCLAGCGKRRSVLLRYSKTRS